MPWLRILVVCLISGVRVRPHTNDYEILGGRVGSRTGFSVSVSFHQLHILIFLFITDDLYS